MHLLSRPVILAWLVTGMLAFMLFAAGPVLVVALTRLMLVPHGAHGAMWLLSGLAEALKVSAAAAMTLTALQLLRRLTRS